MMNALPATTSTDKTDRADDAAADDDEEGKRQRSEFSRMCQLAASHEFNRKIVEIYQTFAKDRSSTLVFCSNLRYVDGLTAAFHAAGVKAKSVCGKTDKDERSETVDDFKAGKFPVLVNCKVFLEGVDLPRVIAYPDGSVRVLMLSDRLYHSRKTDQ